MFDSKYWSWSPFSIISLNILVSVTYESRAKYFEISWNVYKETLRDGILMVCLKHKGGTGKKILKGGALTKEGKGVRGL